MKTESEIMSAPADEVAKALVEYTKWHRCEPPYHHGTGIVPSSAKALCLYIDRAVQLLNQKGEQK